MNKDTVNMLKQCNMGCKAATNNMEQILSHVKNKELRELIIKYNDRHIKLGDECHMLLNETGKDEKDPSKLSMAMAAVGNEIKLTINDSSHKAAELLVDGCNMGIKSLSEYLNIYSKAEEI